MTSLAHRGYIHLGMDVSRDSIAVAILGPDTDVPVIEKISSDPESVRRLIKRVGRPSGIWACYEAGPTGYELHRLLSSMKVRCEVIAPSLVPKGRGDRVKTDKRDARKLAGLHRAGQLTPVAVPSRAQEAVRDLCRTRGQVVGDLTRARNRLTMFLLRHGLVYRDGSKWTQRHEAWLGAQRFDDPALVATYRHYRAAVALRDSALGDVEADLRAYFDTEPFAAAAVRLGGYRGMTHMGGLCIGAEVFDWRRFPKARSFMAFTGLTCWEDSTGLSEHRGSITRAGNSRDPRPTRRGGLGLPAPAGRRGDPASAPGLGRSANLHPLLERPDSALPALPRPGPAQEPQIEVATAVARELAGFQWAEMTAAD